jgi:eukaryotic-like serine/threonine-protein kinase
MRHGGPSGGDPFGVDPFDPFTGGPTSAPQMPAAQQQETNTLATLSVVFAFVFAPAGVVLGHLALSQINQTEQHGRDRALVGVTLSYVFITAAVVALIVSAAGVHAR